MFKAGVQFALSILEFLTGANARTAEGYLTLLDYACGLCLASTYFIDKAFWFQSQPGRQWASLSLLILIGLKYLLSRISVRQELAIGRSLFPPDRVPDDLRLKDRLSITREVIGFMLLYAVLGSVVDNILLTSLIMTGIACFDFATRDRINEGIRQRFADRSYDPRPKEDFDGITRRREIARWYLFALPHLSKELACIEGCAVAFGIAAYGHLNGADLTMPAYATLIGTQILNEIITIWWRFDRFVRLKAISPPVKSGSSVWTAISPIIDIPFEIFEFLTGESVRSSEAYLNFLDYAGGLLLGLALFAKTHFLWNANGDLDWLAGTLLSIIGIRYLYSTASVKENLALGRSLFPIDRLARGLRTEAKPHLTVQFFAFTLVYVLLILIVDKVIFVSLILASMACVDLRTRQLIDGNIRRVFADKRHSLQPGEASRRVIFHRRKIVRRHLSLPHLWKEAGCAVGCAISFLIAVYGSFKGHDLRILAYAILIASLTANQAITMWRQYGRYHQIKAAVVVLDAVQNRTRNSDRVSTAELAPTLELPTVEIQSALQYLSEKGLAEIIHKSARISPSGIDIIKKAREHPNRPIYNFFGPVTYNQAVVHRMEGAALQQAGAESTLVHSESFSQNDLENLREALKLLDMHLSELGLNDAEKRRALAQTMTLSAQLKDDAPDPVIIRQAGRTLRNITEGAIGSLVASGIQSNIWQFVGNVLLKMFGG